VELGKSKILILEDDESVGNSLRDALSRAGHHVFLASRPSQANEILSAQGQIDFLFCDCLLPQMTGLDFIKQARENYPNVRFKVVLMSGIYGDKQFIQESTQPRKRSPF